MALLSAVTLIYLEGPSTCRKQGKPEYFEQGQGRGGCSVPLEQC